MRPDRSQGTPSPSFPQKEQHVMTTTPTHAADQSAAPGPLRVGFIVGRPQGRGSRAPTPVLDLAGLDRAIGTYNDRSHSELRISPRDAWVSDGWLPRMPDSLQELDGLLLTVPKNRVVQRDGIHFQGQRYLAPTLAPFVGTAIDEAHPNLRLSLRDIETARRARRKQLRRAINDRIPTVATREEPRIPEPTKRRPKLRTYE